jgi:hypothetical protein
MSGHSDAAGVQITPCAIMAYSVERCRCRFNLAPTALGAALDFFDRHARRRWCCIGRSVKPGTCARSAQMTDGHPHSQCFVHQQLETSLNDQRSHRILGQFMVTWPLKRSNCGQNHKGDQTRDKTVAMGELHG